jgi:histone deacetylase 6
MFRIGVFSPSRLVRLSWLVRCFLSMLSLRLEKLSSYTCCDQLDREGEQYQSVFLTQDSVAEAKKACAALCTLTEQAVAGDIDHGFAIIRPPGHHAEPGMAGGYCLINNVAVAAAYARAKLQNVHKILVVDWDVHHGNGTQSIFLNDPSVVYFSVHLYQGGNFYPFHKSGGPDTVGVGDGRGCTVNVGWSHKGMGDEEYFAVWEKLLLPMASEFNPDLVLVSAGFDAAAGDLGECNVTPAGFAELTRQLKRTLQACAERNERRLPAPIVCTLEGGYVRSVLGQCVSAVVETLLVNNSDDESSGLVPSDEGGEGTTDIMDYINPSAARNIRQTIKAHRSYWKCLKASSSKPSV